jgi:hypothetical protein
VIGPELRDEALARAMVPMSEMRLLAVRWANRACVRAEVTATPIRAALRAAQLHAMGGASWTELVEAGERAAGWVPVGDTEVAVYDAVQACCGDDPWSIWVSASWYWRSPRVMAEMERELEEVICSM